MKAIIASLILGLWIFSGTAVACSCVPETKEQHLTSATIAFVGRPIKIEVIQEPPPPKSVLPAIRESLSAFLGPSDPLLAVRRPVQILKFLDAVRVTFNVSNYIKGSGPKQITIMTGYGDSDCGLPVSISRIYMVYARYTEGVLRTSYGFGSGEYVPPELTQTCSSS